MNELDLYTLDQKSWSFKNIIGQSSPSPDDSSLIGFTQSGTGAVARSVQSKERDSVSLLDFDTLANYTTTRDALTGTVAFSNLYANASFSAIAAGVFTSTQMNPLSVSLLNGLSQITEFHAAFGSTFNATEAMTVGILVPGSSAVFQANAIAAYINAQGALTNSVAGFFQSRSGANSVHIWGLNPVVQDTAGQTGIQMIGIEVDINANNVGTSGAGITVTGGFGAQPTSFEGITIGKPGSNQFTAGLTIKAGAIFGGGAIDIYQATTGNSQSSQSIFFHGKDAGGVDRLALIQANLNGSLLLTPLAGQKVIASTPIAATATRVTGTRDADNASSVFLEFSTVGRILVEGASAGVLAGFSVVLADSAGGSTITPLAISATGTFTKADALLNRTTTAHTNNAAAQTATLTNGPTAGNPTKWIPIDDNGTTRNIPAW